MSEFSFVSSASTTKPASAAAFAPPSAGVPVPAASANDASSSAPAPSSAHAPESITLLRALDELVLLDKRIAKKTSELQLMMSVSKKNRHLDHQQFASQCQSDWQSVTDLISRRQRIKSAVVVSNAATKVRVNNELMSVAEVIERKKSLHMQQALLAKLRSTREKVLRETEVANAAVDNELQKLLEIHLGGKSGSGGNNSSSGGNRSGGPGAELEAISSQFREHNASRVLDPIHVDQHIKKLEEYIEAFEREAKFTLSESNAITRITL